MSALDPNEPMRRETALALIEDTKRWQTAYEKECDENERLREELEEEKRRAIENGRLAQTHWDRVERLREALNLALMHLEDERAIAAVRALVGEQP